MMERIDTAETALKSLGGWTRKGGNHNAIFSYLSCP